jgi:hypothetical protein
MAQFDLKKATVYFEDGFAAAGTLDTGTYTVGVTTVKVTGVKGSVPVGATFRIENDDQTYVVDSVTPAAPAATTQVTFSPGLAVAAATGDEITFAGRRLAMKIGEGNMTYDEKRTMEYKKDRGKLDTVREGDEEPIDVKLDVQWEWLSSAGTDTYPTSEEVLKREGLASAWVSSSADPCEPYAVNIVVEYDPECQGNPAEIITLRDYRWESLNHDLKAGTLSTSGKCNVTRAQLERRVLA